MKRKESWIALMSQDENEISRQMKLKAKELERYRRRGLRQCVGNVHRMRKKEIEMGR